MLVLTRKAGERLRISVNGVECWVTAWKIDRNKVYLSFDAPKEVMILREEVIPMEERNPQ